MSEVENAQGKEMILAGERMWVEAQWTGDMQDAIRRVRELHKPYKFDVLVDLQACSECSQINRHGISVFSVLHPCPTIKALDSEQ
jgi:alkyl hydroperoxide reductase subunit AhpF